MIRFMRPAALVAALVTLPALAARAQAPSPARPDAAPAAPATAAPQAAATPAAAGDLSNGHKVYLT